MRIRHTRIILIFIILMFVADGINWLLKYYQAPFFRISIFVRALAQLYFLVLLLRRRRGLNIWIMMCFFYLVFLIGSLASIDLYQRNWVESFSVINKMLFFFVCLGVFRLYFKTTESRDQLFKVFEFLVLVEAFTVIIGFIFHLDVLSSYGSGTPGFDRFGYKGLIPAQNETSGFFIIAFFYFLWKIVRLNRGMLQFLTVFVAALLTGTKTSFILVGVLLLYLARWLMGKRIKRIRMYIVVSVFLVALVALLAHDYILALVQPTIGFYVDKVRNLSWSPLETFLSGRTLKTKRFFSDYWPHFGFLNYLFGGHDLPIFWTETDLVDVFISLGLVGGVVFYYCYLKALLFNTKGVRFTHLLFVITWLGASTIAGHLVFSAINGAYLAILILAFSWLEGREKGRVKTESAESGPESSLKLAKA